MEAIKNYLLDTDPDYKTGVELLSTVTKNRTLLNLLRGKENAQLWRKLRFELARYGGCPELAALPAGAAEPEENSPAGTIPADPAPSVAELAHLSPEVQQEVEEIVVLQGQIHNRLVVLSNQLGDQRTDADRKKIVDEQETLEAQYNALSLKKRLLLGSGPGQSTEQSTEQSREQAPADGPAQLTVEEMKDRIKNLRSTRSKAKSKLNLLKDPEKRKEQEVKIAQADAEINSLDLQIKHAATHETE